MIFLCLDTSHKTGSLCLSSDSQVISTEQWENEKSHAEFVTSKIEKAFSDNDMQLKDVDYFCVNNGPGSFTGIRIAINTVKSLAYALNKPILIANSLEIISSSCSVDVDKLVVAVNAHSNLCYYAEFEASSKKDSWQISGEISVKSFDDVTKKLSDKNTVFVGDAFDYYKDLIPKNSKILRPKKYSNIPLAEELLKISLANLKNPNCIKNWHNLDPFYIRDSAPEEKLKNRT